MISFSNFYSNKNKTLEDAARQYQMLTAKKGGLVSTFCRTASNQSNLAQFDAEIQALNSQETAYYLLIQEMLKANVSARDDSDESSSDDGDADLSKARQAATTTPPPVRSSPPQQTPPPRRPIIARNKLYGFPRNKVFRNKEEEKAGYLHAAAPANPPRPAAPRSINTPPPYAHHANSNYHAYGVANGHFPRFADQNMRNVASASPSSSLYGNGRQKSWENARTCTSEASEHDNHDEDDDDDDKVDDEQTVYHPPRYPQYYGYRSDVDQGAKNESIQSNFGDPDDEKESVVMTETEPGARRNLPAPILMIARLLMQSYPLMVDEDVVTTQLQSEFGAMSNYELYQKLLVYPWVEYNDGHYELKPDGLEQELHAAERERMIRNKVQMLLNTLHKDGLEWKRENFRKLFECWIGWKMSGEDERLLQQILQRETPRNSQGVRYVRRVVSYLEILICAFTTLHPVGYMGCSRDDLAKTIQYKFGIELDVKNPYIAKLLADIVDEKLLRLKHTYKLKDGVTNQFEELLSWWTRDFCGGGGGGNQAYWNRQNDPTVSIKYFTL